MKPLPEELDMQDVRSIGTCRHCHKRVAWVGRDPREGDSRKHPVDTVPSIRGTIMIYWTYRDGPYSHFYERLSDQAARDMRQQGRQLYTSHFDTCTKRPYDKRRPTKRF